MYGIKGFEILILSLSRYAIVLMLRYCHLPYPEEAAQAVILYLEREAYIGSNGES